MFLLSFAQFEREVTGERIRDKVAASKKKGMWMGGFVPLGYDAVNQQLVVNKEEAATVRSIFIKYLELRSVTILQEYLQVAGTRSKPERLHQMDESSEDLCCLVARSITC